MAIENIIAKGIGFNPGSAKFIVTHGFTIGEVVTVVTWVTQSPVTGVWIPEDEA
jgi:hypothetical protein